jgi:uncharacterized protein DUF5666
MTPHRISALAALLTVLLVVGGGSSTAAQSLTTVQGTVASATATFAKITTKTGATMVALTAKTRVTRRLPATIADIKVGSFLGVAASKQANGTLLAVSISILDAIKNVARKGQFPMDSGNVMTNANVTAVVLKKTGRAIKMAYDDKVVFVFVPDNTPIRRIVPAKPADLKTGQRVTVRGAAGANGGITASSITIE